MYELLIFHLQHVKMNILWQRCLYFQDNLGKVCLIKIIESKSNSWFSIFKLPYMASRHEKKHIRQPIQRIYRLWRHEELNKQIRFVPDTQIFAAGPEPAYPVTVTDCMYTWRRSKLLKEATLLSISLWECLNRKQHVRNQVQQSWTTHAMLL